MRAIVLTTAILLSACATADPEPTQEPADSVISLERTVCFGACPVYKVEVHMDGRVLWNGERCVGTVGTAEARIDPAAAQALARRFRAARFFHLKDEYRAQVTDMPTHILSFTVHGRTKVVTDYAGGMVGMPASVTELEKAVDETAGTARWTAGGENCLRG